MEYNNESTISAICGLEEDLLLADINGSITVLSSNQQYKIHTKGINDLSWSPHLRLLATVSDDHSLVISSLTDPTTTKIVFDDHKSPVTSVSWCPHSVLVASGGYDENVRLFDVSAQQPVACLPAHADPVTSVAFDLHSGGLLATGSFDGLARLWDGRVAKLVATFIGDTNPAVTSVLFQDQHRLLVGSLDSTIRQWDMRMTRTLPCSHAFDKHKNDKLIIKPVMRGNDLFMGGEDGRVIQYDLNTGDHKEFCIFEPSMSILSLCMQDGVLAVNPFNSTLVKFIKINN